MRSSEVILLKHQAPEKGTSCPNVQRPERARTGPKAKVWSPPRAPKIDLLCSADGRAVNGNAFCPVHTPRVLCKNWPPAASTFPSLSLSPVH